MSDTTKPNVVFIFADQWRVQATGFGGDPNVKTPNLDRLAASGVRFSTAVSGTPVCCPARASLISGRYPHTHGVFVNDVQLGRDGVSIADAFKAGGYTTAWIGKWHVDGRGRLQFTPSERRQGFEFWRAVECTHDYNNSFYYADTPERLRWEGYDAMAQTREAQRYIREHANGKPFFLALSWGPPHDPYNTAPEKYRAMYDPARITLRPNVPPEKQENARTDLAGYYAHCTALDDLLGELLETLEREGIADNTLVVFWSDHGDMLGSQGQRRKQRPWDESIMVPLLMKGPVLGGKPRVLDAPINTPDLMPTLLGLCGLSIPKTVEGVDYSRYIRGESPAPEDAALIACYQPCGEYARIHGGREYRGVRTRRYTYTRTLEGPWLLYDNATDPYQLNNVVNQPAYAAVQAELEAKMRSILSRLDDRFESGEAYLKRWGYVTDETGTVPYKN